MSVSINNQLTFLFKKKHCVLLHCSLLSLPRYSTTNMAESPMHKKGNGIDNIDINEQVDGAVSRSFNTLDESVGLYSNKKTLILIRHA